MQFICLDCKASIEIDAPTKQSAIDIARSKKWAIARDRKKVHCPNCAPLYRSVGCYGGKRNGIQQSFDILTNG